MSGGSEMLTDRNTAGVYVILPEQAVAARNLVLRHVGTAEDAATVLQALGLIPYRTTT